MSDAGLLQDLAVALGVAFAGGFLARLVRIPTLVGYMAAGVALSPFTVGYDADTETVATLADIGVIFLMFGVGLSFDLVDVRRVQKAAVPGGILRVAVLVAAGFGVGMLWGFDRTEALVIGMSICVSSSIVISRNLAARGMLESIAGRVAIGWTVVEDLITVFILALLPSLAAAGAAGIVSDTAFAVGKAAAFVGIMFVLGPRVIPFLLRQVAQLGSRELFIVVVVGLALGIATGAAEVFGVSIAIGAFIAGVVISETEMGHQATADVVPLREAFAVLFFVSVGMLVDPGELSDEVGFVAVLLGVVLLAGPLSVLAYFTALPYPGRVALIVAGSVAQYGEFSFLIARDALRLELIDMSVYNALLAVSALSIAVNPLFFRLLTRGEHYLAKSGPVWRAIDRQGPLPASFEPMNDHVVILGYGRVGELTGHALRTLARPFTIVEADLARARRLDEAGHSVVWGDAAAESVLMEAGIDRASLLVVALPDENSTILAVTNARRRSPNVSIVVRARAREELTLLAQLGVEEVVVPEYEGGLELMSQALIKLGYPIEDAEGYRLAIRDIHYDIDAVASRETAEPI